MYQFKFVVSFVLLLFITSCSSDDDGVVGTWVLDNVALSSCPVDIPNTTFTATDGCVTLFEDKLCLDVSLTSDKTIVITTQYDDGTPDIASGTYTDNGSSVEICFDGDCQSLARIGDALVLRSMEDGCVIEFSFEKG